MALKRKIQFYIDYFKKLNIELEPKTNEEMLEYKHKWVHTYTSDPEAIKHSLPDPQIHNLLWHVFSFEEGKALEGEKASKEYNLYKNGSAEIYIDDIDTLFSADNVVNLTAETIERMCIETKSKYMDIVITASDFSWTYCRTHEVDWLGPYFYKKSNEQYSYAKKKHNNY